MAVPYPLVTCDCTLLIPHQAIQEVNLGHTHTVHVTGLRQLWRLVRSPSGRTLPRREEAARLRYFDEDYEGHRSDPRL